MHIISVSKMQEERRARFDAIFDLVMAQGGLTESLFYTICKSFREGQHGGVDSPRSVSSPRSASSRSSRGLRAPTHPHAHNLPA